MNMMMRYRPSLRTMRIRVATLIHQTYYFIFFSSFITNILLPTIFQHPIYRVQLRKTSKHQSRQNKLILIDISLSIKTLLCSFSSFSSHFLSFFEQCSIADLCSSWLTRKLAPVLANARSQSDKFLFVDNTLAAHRVLLH